MAVEIKAGVGAYTTSQPALVHQGEFYFLKDSFHILLRERRVMESCHCSTEEEQKRAQGIHYFYRTAVTDYGMYTNIRRIMIIVPASLRSY